MSSSFLHPLRFPEKDRGECVCIYVCVLCVYLQETYVKEWFVLWALEGGIILNRSNEVGEFYL